MVGVVGAVDRHVRDRHRRAVGDREIPGAVGRAGEDLAVAYGNERVGQVVRVYVVEFAVPFDGARMPGRLVGKPGADLKARFFAVVKDRRGQVLAACRNDFQNRLRLDDDVACPAAKVAPADARGMIATLRLHVAARDLDAGAVAAAADADAGAA